MLCRDLSIRCLSVSFKGREGARAERVQNEAACDFRGIRPLKQGGVYLTKLQIIPFAFSSSPHRSEGRGRFFASAARKTHNGFPPALASMRKRILPFLLLRFRLKLAFFVSVLLGGGAALVCGV